MFSRILMAIQALFLLLLGVVAASETNSAGDPPEVKIDFERDVRPIFSRSCLKCHGANKPKADLNLTDGRLVLKSGVLTPGNAEKSELLRRVLSHEKGERMPPEGKALSPREISVLKNWIATGAHWPTHWAYRPLQKPNPPQLTGELEKWCRNAIDAFVARELVAKGLKPSPEADRRTLLRRVYFDLIGLPPTPSEMEAFLNDNSPTAFERVVDKLLASPHFGERWARHWMDLVHFAETHGHDQDRPREHAWPYRDYLIRSFNQDKSYSRFVEEQVAGDVLFPGDPWALVGTGMLAAGPWDESSLRDIREDSIDRQIAHYLDRDDIVATVFSTFQSTSVHCARCHDHKFDPIPQREYYGLQAVFAGTDRANRPYDADPKVANRRLALLAEKKHIQEMKNRRDGRLLTSENLALVADWEKRVATSQLDWRALLPQKYQGKEGTKFSLLPDHSLLAGGIRPDKEVYTIVARTNLDKITGVRLEVLVDDSLPHKGPGRQDNGNLHLNEFRVYVLEEGNPSRKTRLDLQNPRADFNQVDWTISRAIDGNSASAWGIYPAVGKSHWASFELKVPIQRKGGVNLVFELEQVHGGGHLIGRPRLSVTGAPLPLPEQKETLAADIVEILSLPIEKRNLDQKILLTAHVLLHKVDQDLAALPAQQLVYCGTNQFKADGTFRPAKTPRTVQVLKRGQIDQPTEAAKPGALSLLPDIQSSFQVADPKDEGQRRAALARWLSASKNVLTWRSIVNRIWQQHFGRGLSDTPNDFGQMGSYPTHPELLDWLAITLQEKGGSLKALHRLIVTSAVYRQSSQARKECEGVDADNRFLWRANRRRLDAESYRDALLLVSGKLNTKMGGPSERQFLQSPGIHVTPKVDYLGFDVDNPAFQRRSIYRFLFRTIPDPFMDAMDCPDGSQLSPKRTISVTALQALATWNDRFAVRQSEHLANRLERGKTSLEERIQWAYEVLYGRRPEPMEMEAVRDYAGKHGLANACRILLNTNEFLFVD